MSKNSEALSTYEIINKGILISSDASKLDRGLVHNFLSNQTHWAKGRSRELVERSIDCSVCFGVYTEGNQIGFSRVITDNAVFAFILDVFIIDEFQGRGIGKELMQATMKHPDLQSIDFWSLATKDAHGLYRKFGFTTLDNPDIWMQFDKRSEK